MGRTRPSSILLTVAATSPHQIAEPLYDHATAQHIGQTGDTFPVAVAVPEGFGEMFGNQQSEIGIFRLHTGILVAVAVGGDNAVGIFIYHDAVGIHAEGTDIVLKFFCPVDDFAFIQLVGKMGKKSPRAVPPGRPDPPGWKGWEWKDGGRHFPSTCCRCVPRIRYISHIPQNCRRRQPGSRRKSPPRCSPGY